MTKLLRVLLLTVLACLAWAASASAATSWQTATGVSYSTVDQPGFFGTAWLASGCAKFSFRDYGQRGWSKTITPFTGCSNASYSNPVLTRDRKTGRLFIVFSEADVISPTRSGVLYTMSSDGGVRWSAPRMLAHDPSALSPVPVAAAARNGTLWVSYQQPPTASGGVIYSLTRASFSLYGYDGATGRQLTKNLTSVKGIYTADDSQSSFKLTSAGAGVVLTWNLTDSGGASRSYVAQIVANKAKFDGEWDQLVPGSPTVISGEDNNVYMMTEAKQSLVDTLSAYKFSFSARGFVPSAGGSVWAVLPVSFAANILDPRLGLSFQVDASGTAYMAYINYEAYPQENCFTGTWACARATAPAAAPATTFVMRRTASGRESSGTVPFTLPRESAGTNTVVWAQAGTGLDELTSRPGQMRYLMFQGWQDVSANGSIGADPSYSFDMSASLSFPTPVTSAAQ